MAEQTTRPTSSRSASRCSPSRTRAASPTTAPARTLAERIEKAGHVLAARAIVSDDVSQDPDGCAALRRRSGDRRRHHHRRHRAHRPRRDARGGRAALRQADRRLRRSSSTWSATPRSAPRPSSRGRLAGLIGTTFVFCLPGSPGACRDAWDHILADQFDFRHAPCNFVEIMPRLDEHLRRAKLRPKPRP